MRLTKYDQKSLIGSNTRFIWTLYAAFGNMYETGVKKMG